MSLQDSNHTLLYFLGICLLMGSQHDRLKSKGVILVIIIYENSNCIYIRYKKAVRKFNSIFSIDPTIPVHYVVGNNDVG